MNFFLDIDRAGSVFALLFAFAVDDDSLNGSDEYDSYSETNGETPDRPFREALFQITRGAKVPEPAILKLRAIFNRTILQSKSGEQTVTDLSRRVKEDFSEHREILVPVIEILLRLSSDDGMLSRHDKMRLQEALDVFCLTAPEFDSLPEREQAILTECYRAGNHGSRISIELAAHYKTLGCEPDVTDAELRRRYRKLAKEYHPDRHHSLMQQTEKLNGKASTNGSNGSAPRDPNDPRYKFESVHRAYEAIRDSRN